MADPWDVYVSFMKMNGVPLLPPVLDKERRSEMQYYQMLAKEVENRISRLTPYCLPTLPDSDKDKDTTSDSTVCDSPPNNQQENCPSVQDLASHIETALNNLLEKKSDNVVMPESPGKVNFHSKSHETKLIYNFGELAEDKEVDLPEKDDSNYLVNCKGVMAKGKKISFRASSKETSKSPADKRKPVNSVIISKKRMSGSLIDLSHKSPERKPQAVQLQRQNSYTLLTPSPQLLAHLESQQQHTGMDAAQLSMSDTQCSPKQKRRSWDLESAKVKWSNMAMELKQQHGVPKTISLSSKTEKPITFEKVAAEKDKPKSDRQSQTAVRAKSNPLRNRLSSHTSRTVMRTDVRVDPAEDKSPPRRPSRPSSPVGPPASPKHKTLSPTAETQIPPQYTILEKEDPSKKVRELLETIQKQQQMQMASLVEKQKREKMMLKQVFEEQNLYLSRQIKNICPELELRHISLDAPTRDPGAVYDPCYDLGGPEGLKGSVSTYVYHHDGLMPPKPRGAADYRSIQYPPFTRNIITQTRTAKKPSPKLPKVKRRASKQESSEVIEFMAEPMVSPVDEHGLPLETDECNIVRGVCVRPAGARTPCSPGACDNHGSVQFTRGLHKPKEESAEELERQRAAATCIVAHARGYLARRLMGTAKVRGYVQTIRDALLCALQLHQDRGGIRGADVDLHRRLIQQITAACYAVHETVITNPIPQKMALIAADRARLKQLAAKQQASVPLQRRASPTASPLQRRLSPTTQTAQRKQSPPPHGLQQRSSHTASTVNRRSSPTTASPTLQRRGSPTFPLAARQSSPIAPPGRRSSSAASPPPHRRASPPQPPSPPSRSPLMQRRPSLTTPLLVRPQQKRTDIMSQSHGGYTQPSSHTVGVMSRSTQDAGMTVKLGRGPTLLQKQRWL